MANSLKIKSINLYLFYNLSSTHSHPYNIVGIRSSSIKSNKDKEIYIYFSLDFFLI